VTTCNHYFCEKCALAHYAEEATCFVCGKNTNGIFNEAKKVELKVRELKRKTEQETREDQDSDGSYQTT